LDKPVALITGVGPGTGTALSKRFSAGGYQVAMLARDRARLDALQREIPYTHAFTCDVTDESQIDAAVQAVNQTLGPPSVLIHNAVGGVFGSFQQIDPVALNRNFQINVMALLHFARRLAPAMIENKHGAIIATGNTSALRGKANFAGFAPTKAAQRILAESIARDLGPKGIHVAYIVIDAVINVPWARAMFQNEPEDFFAEPASIADEIWHVVNQERSTWSFNVDLRPFKENW
jgi:NAD(P)-dependent dehydrogenase (short-subunit alcohol dehydrogenase family)